MKRRWIILLPIMMVTFLIAFLDRTNISFAIPTMGLKLGLTPAVLGFSSGVLFWATRLRRRLAAGWPIAVTRSRWSRSLWSRGESSRLRRVL